MNCHLLLQYRSTHPWALECSQSWLQYCRNQLWIRMTLPTIVRYQISHSYRNRWSALHIIKSWNIPIWITCSSVRISQKPGDRSAVLRVLSDAYTAADRGLVTLLGFVDLSAALDTVDNHNLSSSNGCIIHSVSAIALYGGSHRTWIKEPNSCVLGVQSRQPQWWWQLSRNDQYWTYWALLCSSVTPLKLSKSSSMLDSAYNLAHADDPQIHGHFSTSEATRLAAFIRHVIMHRNCECVDGK